MPSDKAQIRREVRAALSGWGDAARASASKAICEALDPYLKPGAKALVFWPLLSSEPDIRPALRTALARGVEINLPRTDGTRLCPHKVGDFGTLARSELGVLEPSPSQHPETDPAKIGLVLVPGVAFTTSGHRLGRGGGHYDRFLARLPPGTPTIGIAFSKQVLPSLPTEAHDIRVTEVLSDG